MNNWQPIETAPKDGVRILLWFPEQQTSYIGNFFIIWVTDDPDFYDWTHQDPTHWMPLPEPPEVK